MNDKIKELVKTAVLAVDGCTGDEAKDDELSRMYIPDCFAEKFAELIVQECILVIQKDVIRNGDTPENQRTTTHLMAIRDHFGYDNSIFETWKLLK